MMPSKLPIALAAIAALPAAAHAAKPLPAPDALPTALYECAFYGVDAGKSAAFGSAFGFSIQVSSMPELQITSPTGYAALGGSGSFTRAPDKGHDHMFATLTFTSGPLKGKRAHAHLKSNGEYAVSFSRKEGMAFDASDTWCYGGAPRR